MPTQIFVHSLCEPVAKNKKIVVLCKFRQKAENKILKKSAKT